MQEWIAANSDMLNLTANWAMVAIWVVYLQVFLRSFRRQTLPKIVINRAAGSSLSASCFVSNMSSDAIYIESVIVKIEFSQDTIACTVTDFDFFEEQNADDDPKRLTFQGTLAPASYSSLGKFKDLIATVARRTGHDIEQLQASGNALAVEVTIIADYASETLLVGARRKFNAKWQEDHWQLTADAPGTHQIRSRGERKRIYAMLDEMA